MAKALDRLEESLS